MKCEDKLKLNQKQQVTKSVESTKPPFGTNSNTSVLDTDTIGTGIEFCPSSCNDTTITGNDPGAYYITSILGVGRIAIRTEPSSFFLNATEPSSLFLNATDAGVNMIGTGVNITDTTDERNLVDIAIQSYLEESTVERRTVLHNALKDITNSDDAVDTLIVPEASMVPREELARYESTSILISTGDELISTTSNSPIYAVATPSHFWNRKRVLISLIITVMTLLAILTISLSIRTSSRSQTQSIVREFK